MITVIDQARPWLMPSSALAAMTHPQLGAQMIMNGTGRPTSQPRTRTRLRPQASASWPETRLANAFTTPKLTMKETTSVVETDAELLGADQRHDRSLDPDHAADEGVDQDEQRELPPVLLEPQSDRRGSLWTGYSFAHGSGRGRRQCRSWPP